MEQRLWLAFAIVMGVSFAVQVSLPIDHSDQPETTFDTAPRGHAGVFALLDRFDSTHGRWLSGLTMPAVDETVWWITPGGACGSAATEASVDPDEEAPASRLSSFELSARPWIEAGGTALVWLSHPPLGESEISLENSAPPETTDEIDEGEASSSEDSEEGDPPALREDWEKSLAKARGDVREGQPHRCRAILGLALPPRRLAGLEGGAPPVEGRYSPVVFSVGRAVKRREDFDYDGTRVLPGPTLAFFDSSAAAAESAEGWRPLWVEADDQTPLALERDIGRGHLIVIADARILSNGRLARVDSAPFVFDWVRDYGPPWIDEHAHGVVPEAGTFRYLANSPAWAAGIGLLVLVTLVVWRGNAWPTRDVREFDPAAPTLATFVDSVARLYSGTRDHARVFERYRAVCLDRIRRALGLPPGTGVEIILASLRARAKNWPELRDSGLGHLLTKQLPISDGQDLARNAARLDDLVRVLRDAGKATMSRARNQTVDRAEIAATKGNP